MGRLGDGRVEVSCSHAASSYEDECVCSYCCCHHSARRLQILSTLLWSSLLLCKFTLPCIVILLPTTIMIGNPCCELESRESLLSIDPLYLPYLPLSSSSYSSERFLVSSFYLPSSLHLDPGGRLNAKDMAGRWNDNMAVRWNIWREIEEIRRENPGYGGKHLGYLARGIGRNPYLYRYRTYHTIVASGCTMVWYWYVAPTLTMWSPGFGKVLVEHK